MVSELLLRVAEMGMTERRFSGSARVTSRKSCASFENRLGQRMLAQEARLPKLVWARIWLEQGTGRGSMFWGSDDIIIDLSRSVKL